MKSEGDGQATGEGVMAVTAVGDRRHIFGWSRALSLC